jgi:glycosyltransferase involved in cell wall biosynthesis
MRVLLVNPIGTLGGSERSLLDMASSLLAASEDLNLRLLLFAEGALRKEAERMGIGVDVLPPPPVLARWGEGQRRTSARQTAARAVRGALAGARFLRQFRHNVLSFDPTLVHTNGMKAHLAAALALRDRRLVVHLRDFPGERPLSRHVFRLLPKRRAMIVANSRAVADDAERLFSDLRVRVVYNGVDTAAFSPGPRSGELARLASLPPLGPSGLSIGLVATYAFWKGHRLFLQAARRVLASEPLRELRFYVIGGPIYGTEGSELSVSELRTIIRDLGLETRVGLVPFQNDVARVYRELDIVVHASTRPEPFGRTIVEAMATGRPVVVARAGGATELFDEGMTGLGFTPGNEDELTRAILALIRDGALRESLGAAGRGAALSRFDRARLGGEILAVYRELLR